jgi:hypothetical protein
MTVKVMTNVFGSVAGTDAGSLSTIRLMELVMAKTISVMESEDQVTYKIFTVLISVFVIVHEYSQ